MTEKKKCQDPEVERSLRGVEKALVEASRAMSAARAAPSIERLLEDWGSSLGSALQRLDEGRRDLYRELVLAGAREGLSDTRIAGLLRVSRQRVAQLRQEER